MLLSVRQLDVNTHPGIWEVEMLDRVRVLLHLEHGVAMFRGVPPLVAAHTPLEWLSLRGVTRDAGRTGMVTVGSCHTFFVGRDLAVPTAPVAAIYVPPSFGTAVRPMATARTKADLPRLTQRCEVTGRDPWHAPIEFPDGHVAPLALADEDWDNHTIEPSYRRSAR